MLQWVEKCLFTRTTIFFLELPTSSHPPILPSGMLVSQKSNHLDSDPCPADANSGIRLISQHSTLHSGNPDRLFRILDSTQRRSIPRLLQTKSHTCTWISYETGGFHHDGRCMEIQQRFRLVTTISPF